MRVHISRIHFAVWLLTGVAALAAGCGAKTCTPGCTGQVLTSCDAQGTTTTLDCSTQKDSAGKVMTCAFLADQDGYDCIGDYSAGCGDETLEGRCDGTRYIHCLSDDTGDAATFGETPVSIETVDCAKDPAGLTACAVSADGLAGCVLPGTKGCGKVPVDGTCDGMTLSQCVNSSVQTTDCSATNQKCGLLKSTGYGCLSAAVFKTGVGDPTRAVSGTVSYEKKTVDTSSFDNAAKGFAPTLVATAVRRAQVQLIAADGTEIQRSFTDETGAFTLYLPALTTTATVVVSASADPAFQTLTVRDCPMSTQYTFPAGCTDQLGKAYQWQSAPFTGPTALGPITITEASGLGGAFNIFNLMLKGQDFARVNLNHGAYPSTPPLVVEWKKNYETITSYWDSKEIVIQGVASDTDEYDDPVLMHEFGHFLQSSFSVSDSPGGSHDGSPADPRLAFGEGYGTYVGCRISGSSLYFDSYGSGIGVTDVNNTGRMANASDPFGVKQLVSEYLVGEVLWRLDLGTGGNTTGAGASGGLGSTPIFDVLGGYFKNNTKYSDGHGVNGRELVKFVDGLFCRDYQALANGSAAAIQKVVMTDHAFPYDDFVHKIAPIGACK